MEAAGKRYVNYSSRSASFRIWNLSDIHWMSKACAEDEVRKDVQTIADDPYSLWIGGGDYCDFIGYTDKRFDPDAVASWVKVKDMGELGRFGMRQIRDLFWPIRKKCLGLLLGNHEKKYELHTEQESLHAWFCEELGVPNLQYSSLFDVVFFRYPHGGKPRLSMKAPPQRIFSRRQFRIFCHHGAGYAQTPGLARKEPAIGADVSCKKLTQRTRLGVIAGSYLKTYQQGTTTYGEQRGYRPTALGASIVKITPDKNESMAMV